MSKRGLGLAINLAGIALIFVGLAADPLGIGNGISIGWKQWTMAFTGMFVAFCGIWVLFVEAKGSK